MTDDQGPGSGLGFARPPSRLARTRLAAFALIVLSVSLLVSLAPVWVKPARAADNVTATASLGKGFGRIVLTFEALPKYQIKVSAGVLIVTFDNPIDIDIRDIPLKLPDYVIIGRLDPDKKALRFALAQEVKLNTIEAGEKLFIDILPKSWVGLPPALPPDVVAELARRAKETARRTRQAERLKSLKASKFKLNIRTVDYPTFSRVQFDWNAQVEAQLTRKKTKLTLLFDELAKPENIGRLKSNPPRFVVAAAYDLTDRGLKFTLTLSPKTDVRGFREGTSYVVDIAGPPGTKPKDKVTRELSGAPPPGAAPQTEMVRSRPSDAAASHLPANPPPAAAPKNSPPAPDASAKPAPGQAADNQAKPAPGEVMPAKPMAATAPGDQTSKGKPGTRAVEISSQTLDRNGTIKGAEAVDLPAGRKGDQRAPRARVEALLKQLTLSVRQRPGAAPLAVAGRMPDKHATEPLKADARRIGRALRITLPFSRVVPAAVFTRARTLWVVVDTPRKIDLGALRRLGARRVAAVSQEAGPDRQIFQVALSQPFLTMAKLSGTSWHIVIGDLIDEPVTAVKLTRGLRSDGRAKVNIALKDAGKVHWLNDAALGDRIAVVTAGGPVRGMLKAQRFVDFTGLQTAHGLAIYPKTDNLDVRLVKDDVLVTRREGLSISRGGIHRYRPNNRAVADQTRPGMIDFAAWAGRDLNEFVARTLRLQATLAELPERQSIGPRFELARIYLARWHFAESIGVMKRITEINPQIAKDPVFNAMRGVAHLMMHRLKQARRDLAVDGLARDIDAWLWRGLLNAREGNWRAAQLAFIKGDPALKKYPPDIRAMVHLAAARAAIGTNDLSTARFHLDTLPKSGLRRKYAAEALVLRGRFLQALGEHAQALGMYNRVLSMRDELAGAEARFHRAALAFRLGQSKLDSAIEELHALALSWRGDSLELQILRKLAQLQIDKNAYRDSLQTMSTAVKHFPRHPLSRHVQDNMSQVFFDLFLGGKADVLPPVQALSLYYDFRELTPVGRRGDEMIRRLADRLISVDLLTQAAELLEHQVDKRLIGAARAQVAAKLALVHLMNLKPRQALKVLRRSRVAVLPRDVLRERLLLEARALAELGRAQPAVDLLAGEAGIDAAKLRAEAYWRGSKWQEAGEAYEKMLGDKWKGDKPIDAEARLFALRAAIAYSFAKDKLGVARFRSKFIGKMRRSPDANAFAVVTQPLNARGLEFRNLAREIAAVDTLEAFLADFRKRFKSRENATPPAG